jgi:hypothetical protein
MSWHRRRPCGRVEEAPYPTSECGVSSVDPVEGSRVRCLPASPGMAHRCYCANSISPVLRYGDTTGVTGTARFRECVFSSVLNASRLIPPCWFVQRPQDHPVSPKHTSTGKPVDRRGTPTCSRDLLSCCPQSAMGGPCQYQDRDVWWATLA